MEAEVWNLVNHLLSRSIGQTSSSELDKIRKMYPSNLLTTQNVVNQFASFLHSLDDKYQQKLNSRVLTDIAIWIEQIWHYTVDCIRVCPGNSDEGLATVCRVAIQEAWYSDTISPLTQPFQPSDQMLRPVIYLSPGAPPHLRRWLSLNLCCAGLLIVSIPTNDAYLPNINVEAFETIVENDIKQGRQPLLLVAYSGGAYFGSSDSLQEITKICRRFKLWLHVEGSSLLRLALLAKPPGGETTWLTSIKSVNLDLSACVGISHPVNLLLLRSLLPESILLFLNVQPLQKAVAGSLLDDVAVPRLLPNSAGLPEGVLAWISLQLQAGHSEGIVARLHRATDLAAYFLEKIRPIPSIQILTTSGRNTIPAVQQSDEYDELADVLDEISRQSCSVVFRYVLLSHLTEGPTKTSESGNESFSLAGPSNGSESVWRQRFMSDSSAIFRKPTSLEERFVNGLNEWLASALQFEHPNLCIKAIRASGNKGCTRFSPLSAINLMSVTESNIDNLVQNLATNCSIMDATYQHRAAFRMLVDSTPGLYYVYLPDWAGLGAAFFVPHTYRCLFPQKPTPQMGMPVGGAAEPAPTVTAATDTKLVNALLRLSANAAKAIANVNRDVIARLRSRDYAFSSTRVPLPTASFRYSPINSSSGSTPVQNTGVAELLEPLTLDSNANESVETKLDRMHNSRKPGSSDVRSSDNSVPPIFLADLQCFRFGLITPGTDIDEMLQLVLQMASVVEEDSKYVSSLSEVVKRGIEEANSHLREEHKKKLLEEGVLRQVPYLDKLINWWYPPSQTTIPGRTLNLSIGELCPTSPLVRKQSIASLSSVTASEPAEVVQAGDPQASVWQWLPFGRQSATTRPSNGLSEFSSADNEAVDGHFSPPTGVS